MQNHYFDSSHPLRPYTHSLSANPGALPPANALRGDMPAAGDGLWPCESGGTWIMVEDHRGEEGYINREHTIIKNVGPLPEGWSTDPPAPPEPDRKTQILARLAEIDMASIRPLRAIAQGEAVPEDNDRLAKLDAAAERLRSELSQFASKA